MRATILATSLRAKARGILGSVNCSELWNYAVLKNALNACFGELNSPKLYYHKFQSRIQNRDEELPTSAGDLEKPVRLAYPECSIEVQHKNNCAQFISGLLNSSIQEILRLESMNSLHVAVKRTVEVEAISIYDRNNSCLSNLPNQNTSWQH